MAPSATTEYQNSHSTKLSFDTFQNVVDGKLVSTASTRHGINPSNKKPLWEVPVASPADLDTAVAAGQAAFKKWKNVPYDERRKAVLAYADALEAHKDEFAKLLTTEQGKPVSCALRCL